MCVLCEEPIHLTSHNVTQLGVSQTQSIQPLISVDGQALPIFVDKRTIPTISQPRKFLLFGGEGRSFRGVVHSLRLKIPRSDHTAKRMMSSIKIFCRGRKCRNHTATNWCIRCVWCHNYRTPSRTLRRKCDSVDCRLSLREGSVLQGEQTHFPRACFFDSGLICIRVQFEPSTCEGEKRERGMGSSHFSFQQTLAQ